ncbi:MAG TPA: c-type cytochrome [Burkholderiaceae bacterium]|nr:c-type cytochrome [Burkholderiaceae bacterium]
MHRSAIVLSVLVLGAPALAAPSAARGEAIYARCAACHALERNRVGPKHCGLIGRSAGSVPNFDYSPAMKNAHIVWSAQTLDRFLASPLKTVPGTSMTYDGVPDAAERADLIAYLQQASRSPECAH